MCSENMQQIETGENPCRSVISTKLQSNFIEITLWHRCSPVYLLHIFRTPFCRNTSGWLLLQEKFWFEMTSSLQVGKFIHSGEEGSGTSTMRVAPIDQHWWYDRRLSTYDPGSVGHTMTTKLTEPRSRCA